MEHLDSALLLAGGAAFAAVRVLQAKRRAGGSKEAMESVAEPEAGLPLQRAVQDSAADLEKASSAAKQPQRPSSPVGVLCHAKHAELSFLSLDSASSSAGESDGAGEAEAHRRPEEPDPPLAAGDPEWALHEPAAEVDVKDTQSPDRWVKRHRQLIRLTGRCAPKLPFLRRMGSARTCGCGSPLAGACQRAAVLRRGRRVRGRASAAGP